MNTRRTFVSDGVDPGSRVSGWRTPFFAVLLALALVSGACGTDEPVADEPAVEEPAEEEEEEEEAAVEEPAEEEPAEETVPALEPATYVWAIPGSFTSMDSVTYEGGASWESKGELRSTLLDYGVDHLAGLGCLEMPTPVDLTGDVVESWVVDEQGSFIFTLRDNAGSEHGNFVTSEDVRWSLERADELDGIARFLLYTAGSFDGDNLIEVIDERTFKLNVTGPNVLSLGILPLHWLRIYDSVEALEHATDEDPWAQEWLNKNSADFGPWIYSEAEFQPGVSVTLRPNPNYWGTRGNVERFIIRSIPDSGTRALLLETGEVDRAEHLNLDQYAQLQGSSSVLVTECASSQRDVFVLDLDRAPFTDIKVREAISLAIDREGIRTGAYFGFGTLDILGLSRAYYTPTAEAESDALASHYNIDRAKELLAEAGFSDGFGFTLTYTPDRIGPHSEQIALLIRDYLADVNIDVEVQPIAAEPEFLAAVKEGQYEAWLWLEGQSVPDIAYSLSLFNLSTSGQNYHGYANEDYDNLFFALRAESPGPARDAMIVETAELIQATIPAIFLIDAAFLAAMTADITNPTRSPITMVRVWTLIKE